MAKSIDLSTSANSKKRIDFNDARYQLADRLRQNTGKNLRATFTLYDNKEQNKTAVQDISIAYELSDKKLPIGELLNKMVDIIVDLEDGVFDSEKDAIYAWKYSIILMEMYEDKMKRQESLSSFDNGLKNSIINSRFFIDQFPGRYTSRTNFFDQKIKDALVVDVANIFKDIAIPRLYDLAVDQSKKTAEKHQNKILDKIVHWAVDNYKCEVDSFFEIQKDEETQLFFSVNTIILHLKNGYDMSVIGYVGTEHDDKFAVSVLDTKDIAVASHNEKITQEEVQKIFENASNNDPIESLANLLHVETEICDVLTEQYNILKDTKPMVPADILALKAAESVVGPDYIWGCNQFRQTHEDLPVDFKLEDIKLPALKIYDEKSESIDESGDNNELVEMLNQNLFDCEPKKDDAKVFGDPDRINSMNQTIGTANKNAQALGVEDKKDSEFYASATILPGLARIKEKEENNLDKSFTNQAAPAPQKKSDVDDGLKWKGSEPAPISDTDKANDGDTQMIAPELNLNNLDDLFA